MRVKMVECSLKDWYLIERIDHPNLEWREKTERGESVEKSSRICSSDIEGTKKEMLDIAKAIKGGGTVHYRRCAVEMSDTNAKLWSPRNSTKKGIINLEEAAELADQILAYFKE